MKKYFNRHNIYIYTLQVKISYDGKAKFQVSHDPLQIILISWLKKEIIKKRIIVLIIPQKEFFIFNSTFTVIFSML